MALLRVEKVALALTSAERAAVQITIERQSRREMQTLWAVLCNAIEQNSHLEEQKPEVFKKVFGKKYTEKEDYLLRNEYRLLLNKIYDVLAENSHADELQRHNSKHDIALLRNLMAKRLWQEFDAVSERTISHAESIFDYQSILEVMELQFQSVNLRGAISHGRMLEVVELLDKRIHILKEYYVTEALRTTSFRSAAEHMIEASGFEYKRRSYSVDSDFSDISTDLTEYYRYKAIAVQFSGEQRLESAKKAVEHVMKVPDENIPLRREKIIALSTYGTLLMNIAHDYRQAAEANRKAIELIHTYHLTHIDILLYYNYCSALMKCGEYEQVRTIIEEQKERMLNDDRVSLRFAILKAFAHIFLGEWEAALKTLPPHINRFPESEYHYAWYMLSIIAYMRGDSEDALREITNFAKRFSRRNIEILQPQEHELVSAYRSFYQGALAMDTKKKAKFFAETQKHIERCSSFHGHYQDYLPIVWLRGALEKQGIA